MALSLRQDPESPDPVSSAELEEAMRVCLVTAAEEAFPREIKALKRRRRLPNNSVLRNVSPTIDPTDGLYVQIKCIVLLKYYSTKMLILNTIVAFFEINNNN